MRFLTWCNQIDERSELLFASARHFGIDVEPIGLGKEYRGGVSKIEWLRDWLAKDTSDSNDIIFCTDSHDCIYLRCPIPLVLRIVMRGMTGGIGRRDRCIIYAGEKWYRKRPPEYQAAFDKRCPEGALYRYPNGGLVAGRASMLRIMCQLLMKWAKESENSSEQWHLTRYIAECPEIVQIDYQCDLFWCCAGQWRKVPKLASIENGRLTNLKTGGQPYVLHAPIPNRSRALLRDIAGKLGVPLP